MFSYEPEWRSQQDGTADNWWWYAFNAQRTPRGSALVGLSEHRPRFVFQNGNWPYNSHYKVLQPAAEEA